jgi:hypothetical protein
MCEDVNTTGSSNTAIGAYSLYFNQSGEQNVAIGREALRGSGNTGGSSNTAGGNGSLYATIGDSNTGFGCNTLRENTTGSSNTAIGFQADVASGDLTNCTSLGNNAICNDSNQITLGNSSISALRCQVTTITALSDQRDKKDIEPLGSSLSFVEQLKPVHFNWNMRDGGKVDIPEIGFIAQDLQKVQLDTGMKVPNLVYDVNPDRLEASYGTLLPLLVKSIQELSLKNQEFVLRNQEFTQEIQELKKEIAYLHDKID